MRIKIALKAAIIGGCKTSELKMNENCQVVNAKKTTTTTTTISKSLNFSYSYPYSLYNRQKRK